jgi:hypothetical protein
MSERNGNEITDVGDSVGIGELDCMTSLRVGIDDTGASLRGIKDALIKISSSIEGEEVGCASTKRDSNSSFCISSGAQTAKDRPTDDSTLVILNVYFGRASLE